MVVRVHPGGGAVDNQVGVGCGIKCFVITDGVMAGVWESGDQDTVDPQSSECVSYGFRGTTGAEYESMCVPRLK